MTTKYVVQNDNFYPLTDNREDRGNYTRGKYVRGRGGATVPEVIDARMFLNKKNAEDLAEQLNQLHNNAWEPAPQYSVIKVRITVSIV